MNDNIVSICKSLSGEAGAIISYTNRLAGAPNELKTVYEHIRMNQVEHIQQLCIALTKEIVGGQKTEEAEDDFDEPDLDNEEPTIAWEGDREEA